MSDVTTGSATASPIIVAQASTPPAKNQKPGASGAGPGSAGQTAAPTAAPPEPKPARTFTELSDQNATTSEQLTQSAVKEYRAAASALPARIASIEHSKASAKEKQTLVAECQHEVDVLRQSAVAALDRNLKFQDSILSLRTAVGGRAKERLDTANRAGEREKAKNGKVDEATAKEIKEATDNYDKAAAAFQTAVGHAATAKKMYDDMRK